MDTDAGNALAASVRNKVAVVDRRPLHYNLETLGYGHFHLGYEANDLMGLPYRRKLLNSSLSK